MSIFKSILKALNLGGDEAPKPSSAPAPKPQATPRPAAQPQAETPKAPAIDVATFPKQCLKLLGGHDNIMKIDSCVTRIRVTLKDTSQVDDSKFKAIGATAVVRIGDKLLHIVVGSEADNLAAAIKAIPVSEDLSKVEVSA